MAPTGSSSFRVFSTKSADQTTSTPATAPIRTAAAQTIFDAGIRRAENEQAQAQYDQTVANYRQTVLNAFQAVEDDLASLRILSQEIEQEQTAVASANHYLGLSLTRFKAGVD